MTKRAALEQILDDLAAVRRDPALPDARERILAALASPSNYAVSRAATVISEHKIDDLSEALVQTFDRLMENPTKRDPQCAGTIAIVRALHHTDAKLPTAMSVYLRGLAHHQHDGPVESGRVTDSAGQLRGHCGLALLDARYRDAPILLVNLLADPELAARVAGARGLGSVGREEAGWVLRLHLLSGVKRGEAPEVLTECMIGLLRLDPERSLPLVTEMLSNQSASGVRESAAFALGESRHPAALSILSGAIDNVRHDDEWCGTVLTSIAMLRSAEAKQKLVTMVESAPVPQAVQAIGALEIYRRDDDLRTNVRGIVDKRGNADLSRAFAAVFGEKVS